MRNLSKLFLKYKSRTDVLHTFHINLFDKTLKLKGVMAALPFILLHLTNNEGLEMERRRRGISSPSRLCCSAAIQGCEQLLYSFVRPGTMVFDPEAEVE